MTKHTSKRPLRLTTRGKRVRTVAIGLGVVAIHAPAIGKWQAGLTDTQFYTAFGMTYLVAIVIGFWVMESL